MSHPDDSTIERFAMGGLDDDAAFIAHVGGCEECSRKLQREAEIEIAMIDVQARAATLAPPAAARAPGGLRVRSSLARRAIGPAIALAAAAAMLVWVGRQRVRSERASSEGTAVQVVSCADGPKQIECIAEAHRSGHRLEYPKDTALAALGSEPGLTLCVVPRFSDGVVVDVDELLVKVKADLKTCGDQAIVSQDAPMRTGEIGLDFSIAPDGRVQDSQTTLILQGGSRLPDLDNPMVGTDMALARCLRRTIEAFPFKGPQTARISLTAKYVWRE